MKNLFRYWLPVIAYMAFIFYLSSRSQFPMEAPQWMFFADKFVHATLYGGLGFFFLRALVKGQYSTTTLTSILLAIALTSIYGVSDEFHQSFVPGRTPDVQDWIADTVGAIVICAAFFLKNKFFLHKRIK